MKNKFFYLLICIIILCGITIIFSCFSGDELPGAIQTGTSTGIGTGTETGTTTGTVTGTATGISTGTATGTETGTVTGTTTGTSTGTSTGTETGTATGLPEPPTFGFLNINTALTSSYLSSGFIVGTASDNYGTISTVEYSLDGGTWLGATGTDNWKIMLPVGANAVVSGTNTWLDHTKHTLELRVYDNDGSNSISGIITFNKGLNQDFNGDGYADVVVGAPYNDNSGSDAGRAYIFYGNSSGISDNGASSADTILTGTASGGQFGRSSGSCGDVDGDGYADLFVAAHNAGAVYVWHGNSTYIPSGDASTADTAITSGGSYFGYATRSCNDVNGDGYDDIIVGKPGSSIFYVFHGSSNGLLNGALTGIPSDASTTITGGGWLGMSVGSGDVNGDGYADAIAGATHGGSNTGNAYIFHGSSNGLLNGNASGTTGDADTAINGVVSSGEFFGKSVGSGDVNGDGYVDAIIGAPYSSKTYIFHGSSTGIASGDSASANTTLTGSGQLGWSASGCNDVNGDGYDDVIAGAHSTANGTAYVYHGSSSGITNSADTSVTGSGASDRFGQSVASCGDINGDGYADAIVGAHANDDAHSNAGAAYTYHGNSTGIASSVNATLLGEAASDSFGCLHTGGY